jgi:nucleotide-binding universal stress UspA family protein
MFKKIFVPLDGTRLAQRAVGYAVAIARVGQTDVVLYHSTAPLALQRRPADERAAALVLDALAADLRSDGVTVETLLDHAFYQNVEEAIVESARACEAELIVMATHGRHGPMDAVLGSTTERVVRTAGVPVLAVPTAYDEPWSTSREVRILVPLDGSALAEAALGPAIELATALAGSLLLTHFVEGEAGGSSFEAGVLKGPEVYLSQMASDLRDDGTVVEVLAGIGSAASGIVAAARERQVDLIVMATHARRGLARLRVGSVTEATLERATVPVLVVQPPPLQHLSGAPVTVGGIDRPVGSR